MENFIEFQQVEKTYTGSTRSAVHGVSMSLQRSEVITLVGESGSGKSTLLRLVAGLETLDSGSILIDGETVSDARTSVPPHKRKIGLVFQDGALFPHLTVSQNVIFGLPKMERKDKSKSQLKVDFMLAMVNLSGKGHLYPHQLSGGERQRLALARALAPQPHIVLMDEPFSSLDVTLRRTMRYEVQNILSKLRSTAIFVTHDPEEALSMGTRVAVLQSGTLVQLDTPKNVYLFPKNAYCAQLFGVANCVVDSTGNNRRWLRPEHMKFVEEQEKKDDDVRVVIERVHHMGHHIEVIVKPKEHRRFHSEQTEWIVHVSPSKRLDISKPLYVRLDLSNH